MTSDRLLNPKEAAARLSITVEQLSALVSDGEIAYVIVGRGLKRPRRRYAETDLDDFIDRHRRRETQMSTRPKSRRSRRLISRDKVMSFSDLCKARLAEKRKRVHNLHAERDAEG